MGSAVYLDYNASAPIRPEAAAALSEALGLAGNASSVHGFGRALRHRIETARKAAAALVGAAPAQVIFTSGGTEANNLALRGDWARVLVSAGEHDSARQAVPEAEMIRLGPDGVLRLDSLDQALAAQGGPALVSVMLANNETGVIQPIARIAELVHGAGALLHCDAVQAAGKIPVDMAALGADLLSLSAHKLGGPQGVGALVVREGIDLPALLRGGGQERRRRAGTENAAGIAGFGAAAEAASRDLDKAAGLAALRDALEAQVRALAPEAKIFGAEAPRLANTSCLTMPGVAAETQVVALDLAGVAVSAGAACSSGKVTVSHVLQAMGAAPDEAATAIRVSFGWRSAPADVEHFIAAWSELYRRAGRGRSAA